jgi:hypothetical protein
VVAAPPYTTLRAAVRWLAWCAPAHFRAHLGPTTLLVALLVSLAGCGSTAGRSAAPDIPGPSPTVDLACVTRARSVDLTARA